ncbi:hypothetical protein FEM03_14585 [Phragmitibacter flavus]|uniref:Uncharacterized protein n=1 Tax=Phragmitibacter flavus TaxID=2576071 RepID=A0A5R8KDF8_9BACT|nr:hypothetical protein FEM03_14585 [Phragmitibacter flavus]
MVAGVPHAPSSHTPHPATRPIQPHAPSSHTPHPSTAPLPLPQSCTHKVNTFLSQEKIKKLAISGKVVHFFHSKPLVWLLVPNAV